MGAKPKSFSRLVKDDICTKPTERAQAELAGMTLAAGDIDASDSEATVRYTTEHLPSAKRLMDIVRNETGLQPHVHMARVRSHSARTVVVEHAAPMLEMLEITGGKDMASPPRWLEKEADRTAMVRGAFLACGTVSNPRKNYHLEFVLASESFAHMLRDILHEFSIRSNIVTRREHFVLYLNEGDGIAALLALIGAHASILNFENVRILKETRNNVNRAVNCETANINRTVNAAQAQVDSIRLIEREIGLDQLTDALREAAELRLEHPEASLQELCELCGTTKSGMNHRLRKVNAIARALSGEV